MAASLRQVIGYGHASLRAYSTAAAARSLVYKKFGSPFQVLRYVNASHKSQTPLVISITCLFFQFGEW